MVARILGKKAGARSSLGARSLGGKARWMDMGPRTLGTLIKQKEAAIMGKASSIGMSAVFVLLLLAGSALAGPIHDRISDQQRRIDEGIRTGQLTHSEAATLQDNLNWIKETEARLKADGRLTPPERKKLDRMLDRNNDMIRHKKNNPARRLY